MESVALSEQEIKDITHYNRAAEQIRFLKSIGITALRRRDNTVFVNRFEYMAVANKQNEAPAPKLKSIKK